MSSSSSAPGRSLYLLSSPLFCFARLWSAGSPALPMKRIEGTFSSPWYCPFFSTRNAWVLILPGGGSGPAAAACAAPPMAAERGRCTGMIDGGRLGTGPALLCTQPAAQMRGSGHARAHAVKFKSMAVCGAQAVSFVAIMRRCAHTRILVWKCQKHCRNFQTYPAWPCLGGSLPHPTCHRRRREQLPQSLHAAKHPQTERGCHRQTLASPQCLHAGKR